MGSIVCTNKKTPPVTVISESQGGNPFIQTDQQLEEVKDNNDEYFDEQELKIVNNNVLTLNEIQTKQIKWISLNHYLGSGSFGSVELVKDVESGQYIALKQLSLKGFNPKQIQTKIDSFEYEIKVLSQLTHPNIVKYLGVEQTSTHINLFLEHVPGGSIKSLLERYGKFPEEVVGKYTKQILWGIEYLHRNGIIHRDIKGANILVDNNGICKLADFGSSKKLTFCKDECKTFTGTPNWMAPEVINGKGHGRFADIWSLGCTIIEMLTGKPPWSDETKNQYQIIMEIMKGQPLHIPNELSQQAKDFLSHCFEQQPNKRWNVVKLLNHPFIPKVTNNSYSADISSMFKPLQIKYN